MSMKTIIDVDADAWAIALRDLMGYPLTKPAKHTLAFAVGGPLSDAGIFHHCNIARQLNRNMLRVEVGADYVPIKLQLAIRDKDKVTWHSDCVAYAASDTAPIEILTRDALWRVGTGLALKARKVPANADRVAGVERAARRWGEAAATLRVTQLNGTVLVPLGTLYEDGIPVVPRHAV